MPPGQQRAAGLLMVRFALFAAGLLSMVMWPFVLLLMVVRDRVGGCNWATSDISGTAEWSLVPPQLTCSWDASQLQEITDWALANDGGNLPVLEPGAATIVEQIPVSAVSWVSFGMFVFGLILVRLATVIKHQPSDVEAEPLADG